MVCNTHVVGCGEQVSIECRVWCGLPGAARVAIDGESSREIFRLEGCQLIELLVPHQLIESFPEGKQVLHRLSLQIEQHESSLLFVLRRSGSC